MSTRRCLGLSLGLGFLLAGAASGAERDRAALSASRLLAGEPAAVQDGAGSTYQAAGGPRVYLKPIRTLDGSVLGAGDRIRLTHGGVDVLIEGYFGGWGPRPLRSYCIGLGVESFDNRIGVPLEPSRIPCSTNAQCQNALGVTGFTPELKCNDLTPNFCNPVFQQIGRPDWLGGTDFPGCFQELLNCGNVQMSTGWIDDGRDYYDFSAIVHVPVGAYGSYTVSVDPPDVTTTFLQVVDPNSSPPDPLLTYTIGPAFIDVGIDDVCGGGLNAGAPCSTHGDCVDGYCQLKNRFLSLWPSAMEATLGPMGIQVTVLGLSTESVQDPNAYTHAVRWAGAPTLGLGDESLGTVGAAALQCEFHAHDWSDLARLHLYGDIVVPSSDYQVRLCSSPNGPCFAPLLARTGKFGDVAPPLIAAQPSFLDISGLVDAFQGKSGATTKFHAKLREPVDPAAAIGFLEISAGVSAFQGKQYKTLFPTPPATCP